MCGETIHLIGMGCTTMQVTKNKDISTKYTTLEQQTKSANLWEFVPRYNANYLLFVFMLDIISIIFALLLVNFAVQLNSTIIILQLDLITFSTILVVWTTSFVALSVYDIDRSLGFWNEIKQVVIASILSVLVVMGIFYLFEIAQSRSTLLAEFSIAAIVSIIWRLMFRIKQVVSAAKKMLTHQHILIVGTGDLGQQIAELIERSPGMQQVVGFVSNSKKATSSLPVVGSFDDDISEIVKKESVDEVVIALPNKDYDKLSSIVIALRKLSIPVHVVPSYLNLALYTPTVRHLGDLSLINLQSSAMTSRQRLFKRVFDIMVSGFAIFLTLPVMIAVAIAIKLDSQGPVLFKQVRVGENGKPFKMFKFRSMVVNAEALQKKVNQVDENGNVIHKSRNDPRVTRMGRIVRKTSLDELPQLFNVFFGDMSLVGPRPELAWIVENYQPWQHQRFDVPQGITGWWQVNGRSDKPCHLNTDQDIYYVKNYSFWLDVKILLMTVPALLKGKGAF